jgi:hypothetical protein
MNQIGFGSNDPELEKYGDIIENVPGFSLLSWLHKPQNRLSTFDLCGLFKIAHI